jgi:hypothetical protein
MVIGMINCQTVLPTQANALRHPSLQDCNRLELSEEVDKIGLPKPKITFTYGPNEAKLAQRAVALMSRVGGGGRARCLEPSEISSCDWHLQDGRERGDRGCRSLGQELRHPQPLDLREFHISECTGANPALTIMAISLPRPMRLWATPPDIAAGES